MRTRAVKDGPDTSCNLPLFNGQERTEERTGKLLFRIKSTKLASRLWKMIIMSSTV